MDNSFTAEFAADRLMEIASDFKERAAPQLQITKYVSLGLGGLTALAITLHQFLQLPLDPLARAAVFISIIAAFANSFACDRVANKNACAVVLQLCILLVVAAFSWNTGGLNAPVMLLLLMMPVLGAMTIGSKAIVPSLIGVLILVLLYSALGYFRIALPDSILPPDKTSLLRTNTMLMIAGMLGIACHFFEIGQKRFQCIAESDGLTGIKNRRAFDSYLENEWLRQKRHQSPISLIMIDIDDFKGYNDTHGHLAGDGCLKSIAAVLTHYSRRAGEECFRYGGEEFCLVLGNTSQADAVQTAEKIARTVASLSETARSGFEQPVTLSAGVATLTPAPNQKPDDLIAEADEQLYISKQNGRNRVSADATKLAPNLSIAAGSR